MLHHHTVARSQPTEHFTSPELNAPHAENANVCARTCVCHERSCSRSPNQNLSMPHTTAQTTLSPRIPKPQDARRNEGRLTTATNCEFSGKRSWKSTDVEELNGTFVIRRASMAFGRGEGPDGMISRLYGAFPPSPVIWTVRLWHWRGVLTMLNEYAAANDASSATATTAGSTRPSGRSGKREEGMVRRRGRGHSREDWRRTRIAGKATDEGVNGRTPLLEPAGADGVGSTVLIGGDWFHTALLSRRLHNAPEPS